MRHIIVIAGNITQFQAYARDAIKKGMFAENYQIGYGNKIITEGVTFMYVYNDHQLCGYTLDKNAVLVKVGTWYELPAETTDAIEKQFDLRTVIKKCVCN